ncbi:hypothetical protein NL676_007040 [Syzygium grande]|nr:hypothetical protein NL676_007040 [Syzygium grande]
MPRSTAMPGTPEARVFEFHNRSGSVSATHRRPGLGTAIRIGPCLRVDRQNGSHLPTSGLRHYRRPAPSDKFQALLTLFSKSFHLLAVLVCYRSSSIFSLDGIYRPTGLYSKQPDSPADSTVVRQVRHDGALTLSGAPFQELGGQAPGNDFSGLIPGLAVITHWALPG